MEISWLDILKIIGSVAFFIYGMKVMSEGIQRAAGSQMRTTLRRMTKNPFLGIFTGFLVTGLIQSSSATTVMTVSFVNAGLMTLVESAGIIIGSNIGTTITGWLIATLGFSFSINSICLPLFALGVPLIFIGRGKFRFWGEVVVGFAIIFIALEALKSTFPDPETNAHLLKFLQEFTGSGIPLLMLMVLIGMAITMIIQSSSAAMVITFVMCVNGWLPFHSGAAMVLGSNIGTTITAEIAAVVGNVYAKRAARIHLLFNVIGALWMVVLIPLFVHLIDHSFMVVGIGSPVDNPKSIPLAIAAFHTLFNLINGALLIGFIKPLVKLATWSIRSKGEGDEVFRLRNFMGGAQTAELSIVQVQQELNKYADITSRMSGFTQDFLFNNEPEREKSLFKRIKKYEKINDRFQLEIVDYLTHLSQDETSQRISTRIRSYLSIVENLENCADLFFQMAKSIQRKKTNKIWFTPSQRNRLKEMFGLMDRSFAVMKKNLATPKDLGVDSETPKAIEKKINKLRKELRKNNLKDVDSSEYNIKSALVYFTIFTSCEKIGDNVLSITEALVEEPNR